MTRNVFKNKSKKNPHGNYCVSFKPTLLSALSVPSHTESETREELYCVVNPVNNTTCYMCYCNIVHL